MCNMSGNSTYVVWCGGDPTGGLGKMVTENNRQVRDSMNNVTNAVQL